MNDIEKIRYHRRKFDEIAKEKVYSIYNSRQKKYENREIKEEEK